MALSGRSTTVVVDTNVFSADLLRATQPLVELYRPLLIGRRFLISFQTLAEVEYGLRWRDWGVVRIHRVQEHIQRAEVVWPGPALLAVYVELRIDCRRAGHALAQQRHNADRWIAATAIHLAVPLVSHDGVFRNTPGLAFETALAG